MNKRCFVLFALAICAGLNACNTPGQEKAAELTKPESAAVISRCDSVTTGLDQSLEDSVSMFSQRIVKAAALLSEWGFKKENEVILRTPEDFSNHWWLRVFQRPQRLVEPSLLPQAQDWADLQEVTQYTFKKNWKYIIEEWQFADEYAARRWLKIALNTAGLDDAKPPRIFWAEGSRMYFVMATAAADWFQYSDQLLRTFTGRSAANIWLFTRFSNLSENIEAYGGTNRYATEKEPHYFQPDSEGTFYRHAPFDVAFGKYSADELKSGFSLITFVYGIATDSMDKEVAAEEVISVKSKLPGSRFGNLDFAGQDLREISDSYALSGTRFNDLLVEAHDGTILILHIDGEKIDWFHFVQTPLKDIKSAYDLPEALRHF